MGTSENSITGKHVIALAQQCHERAEYGAHAGGSGIAGFRSFKRADLIDEFPDIGIAETTVDVVICFIRECGAHIFCLFKAKATGKEQGYGMLHFGGTLNLNSNGIGFGAK
jgi:hypothetical protein